MPHSPQIPNDSTSRISIKFKLEAMMLVKRTLEPGFLGIKLSLNNFKNAISTNLPFFRLNPDSNQKKLLKIVTKIVGAL